MEIPHFDIRSWMDYSLAAPLLMIESSQQKESFHAPTRTLKGIVPHLVVKDATKAIEFYKAAFGAEEIFRMPAPDGKRLLHGELRIGSATIFLCDDFPEYRGGKPGTADALGGTPITLHQNVPDCDAAIARAANAGTHGDDACPGYVLGRPLRPGARSLRAHVGVRRADLYGEVGGEVASSHLGSCSRTRAVSNLYPSGLKCSMSF